jgi:Tse2 ADP-ribosyltransferase toxins
MPETPSELFTNVPVDLFRMGNASGPRLDNVRPQDVDIVEANLPNGQVVRMVHPRGGISTFDGVNQRLPGKWWRIPAGTILPDTIRIVRDQRDPRTQLTHYSIRPTRYMTLVEFVSGLQTLAMKAVPMFTVQGGTGEPQSRG